MNSLPLITTKLSINLGTPIAQRITEKQNKVVITDRMWARVLCSTNQPCFLSHEDVERAGQEDEEPHLPNVEGDNSLPVKGSQPICNGNGAA
jgi:6-phosphofructokinase 1